MRGRRGAAKHPKSPRPGAPAGAPNPVGNVHRVDQPIVMLFSTPADRPRWTADATGRRQLAVA